MNGVSEALKIAAAIKAFVATLPSDLSAYPDSDGSEYFPNNISCRGKSIPINWDGSAITLAT